MPHHIKKRKRSLNQNVAKRNASRSNRVKVNKQSKSNRISKAKSNIKAKADLCRRFIYNYSDYNLSDMHIIALSKGFKFIPLGKRPPRSQILQDFHQLARKMRMKYIMRSKSKKQPLFKLPSSWDPRSSDNIALEEYLDETMLELSKLKRRNPKSNISKAEQAALNELRKNKSIVIKPVDKGKACAVVSRDQYIKEAHRQLSAFQYRKIDHDMTPHTAKMADNIVEDLFSEKYIDKHTREYLISDNNTIKVPSLYLLVKAHKPKPSDSDFCGRPIISGCCSATRALSEYLDYFLLPLVQQQNTYLKDSMELIKILANLKLPQDITLVTADVTSLYTNIPQDQCLEIVVDRLDKSNIKYQLPKPPPHLVRRILEIILKRNCFEFNDEFYLQVVGAAQGNILSPEISDLVMYVIETEFILTDPNIVFYRRYRDDILLFYQGDCTELQNLKSRMNKCHPTLKFTFEISDNTVTYLDLQIHKGERFLEHGLLDHRINMKKTDTNQWLSPDSAHCPSVFSALVLGEAIRYVRGHTSETCFIEKVNFFTNKLVERGYDRPTVNEITNKVKFVDRNNHLNASKEGTIKNKKNIPLVLVTTYTPYTKTHDLKSALLKHWGIIQQNSTLNALFPNSPILAFKRAKNLADMLVKSKLPRVVERQASNEPASIDASSKGMPPIETTHSSVGISAIKWDDNDRELLSCLLDLMN